MPDPIPPGEMEGDSRPTVVRPVMGVMKLKLPMWKKGRYVQESRRLGMTLSAWVEHVLDSKIVLKR